MPICRGETRHGAEMDGDNDGVAREPLYPRTSN
ncbi:hypothetical protein [Sphingomonas montana]|nr:hypothetical protein [Sphingomonas montana]